MSKLAAGPVPTSKPPRLTAPSALPKPPRAGFMKTVKEWAPTLVPIGTGLGTAAIVGPMSYAGVSSYLQAKEDRARGQETQAKAEALQQNADALSMAAGGDQA